MNISLLGRIWAWVKWPLLVLVIAYAVLVGYRTKYLLDEQKTAEAVAKIHNTRLTKEELFGYMPPAPDPVENNKTLAGIDSNKNGIRDDVEIAIYNAHKDSAKETAAAFQYAKALQMEFTQVSNSETLVAVIQQEARGYACARDYADDVESLVFNTDARRSFRESILQKYMTSYALPNTEDCDITF